MIPWEIRVREFTLDGRPTDIVDFICENVAAECFDVGDIEDIRLLEVGQSIHYGGGAAASFTLARIA